MHIRSNVCVCVGGGGGGAVPITIIQSAEFYKLTDKFHIVKKKKSAKKYEKPIKYWKK